MTPDRTTDRTTGRTTDRTADRTTDRNADPDRAGFEYVPAELQRADTTDVAVRKLREHMERTDDAEADALHADQLKDLLLMESSASEEQLERPYLTRIPGKYAAEVTLFEWLDFMLGEVGMRGTLDAIEFYVRVGWLGESAAEELRDHVRGFRELAGKTDAAELDGGDHVLSLVYIARLASMA